MTNFNFHKYVEFNMTQVPKGSNIVCGDYSICFRTHEYTSFILCDGMGSGHQAHISATLCASRILNSLKAGLSLYKVCENVISSMHLARSKEIPYSTFTVINIMHDGNFVLYSYEMPKTIKIENNFAYVLEPRYFKLGHEVVAEVTGLLKDNESLLVFSDGVSQAGMGISYTFGWGENGVCLFTNKLLDQGINIKELSNEIVSRSFELSGNAYGDDTSLAVLKSRKANCLNILSGPPANRLKDKEFVEEFIKQEGLKVICGSSTADMVARVLEKRVTMPKISTALAEPPVYEIEGFDLVTEGILTLNQLFNLLEEDGLIIENSSCVSDLYEMVNNADIVRFFIGTAKNSAHDSGAFKQLRIIQRNKIIELISEKLKESAKLVILKKV